MKFNIDDYKGNYVMHCKTYEEAKSFCGYLHKHGREWRHCGDYNDDTNWQVYEESTIYYFNEGMFGDINNSDIDLYTILEWSDFTFSFTKADLKTGDVILRRNGQVEIVNLELGMFILPAGWNDLDSIRDDLTCITGDRFDIVAVRRPIAKYHCKFDAFEEERGTLIYDRERDEVEELTLAEVCKLLGKNIKIIQ